MVLYNTGDVSRRTFVHLLCLVVHDHARKINRFQHLSRISVSSPTPPVEEDPCTNRSDKCNLDGAPVGGALDLGGLIRWDGYFFLE